jgi:hypothetical protein
VSFAVVLVVLNVLESLRRRLHRRTLENPGDDANEDARHYEWDRRRFGEHDHATQPRSHSTANPMQRHDRHRLSTIAASLVVSQSSPPRLGCYRTPAVGCERRVGTIFAFLDYLEHRIVRSCIRRSVQCEARGGAFVLPIRDNATPSALAVLERLCPRDRYPQKTFCHRSTSPTPWRKTSSPPR